MKSSNLSLLAGFLGAVNGIDCHFEHSLPNGAIPKATMLPQGLQDSLSHFCQKGVDGVEDILTLEQGQVTLQVVPVQDEVNVSVEECLSAFQSILSLCVERHHVWGGEYFTRKVVFDVHHTDLRKRDIDNIGYYGDDDDENALSDIAIFEALKTRPVLENKELQLEAKNLAPRRARGGSTKRLKSSQPKPSQKTRPKPSRKPKFKPLQKPKPPNSTSKPKRPSPKTNSHHSTKTSSGRTEPSVACKVLNKRVKQELVAMVRSARLESRDEATLHDNALHLEKRTSLKYANGCGVEIRANAYPQRREMSANAIAYGYSQPNTCLNFQFVGGPYHRRHQRNIASKFDVEHTLEWSTVTKFWDWMNTKDPFKRPNPTPGSTGRVGFCGFWRAVWHDGPAIPIGGLTLTPNKHLAHAYPSNTRFKDEFAFLQDILNQTPKQQMWAPTKNPPGIFDIDKMTDKISGTVVEAREAMIMLKALLGAHSYMKTPHVNYILGKQKSRIGKVLEAIDKELPNHPRHNRKGQAYPPWKRIGLKNYWDKYMDMKFNTAISRTKYSMDHHLRQAEQRWIRGARNRQQDQQTPQHRELRDMIRAIAKRWRKDKNAWSRPASWGVKGGVGGNRHPKPGAGIGNGDDHSPALGL